MMKPLLRNHFSLWLFGYLMLLSILGTAQTTPQFYNGSAGNSSNSFPLNSTTSNKVQWIYDPGMFNSNGTTGTPAYFGFITRVYFRLGTTANGTNAYTDYTISLGQNVGTQTTWTNGNYTTGLTQCFFQPSFVMTGATASQWYGVTLQTPFLYNPAQSLVFELKVSAGTGNTVYQFTTNGNRRIWGLYTATTGSFGTGLVDFGMDLMPATPCAGQPNAGTAGVASTCPTTLSLVGSTLAGGLTWQWQKRAACGSWTNIPGATSYGYTVVSQTGPTDYRAYMTCTNSGLTDTSGFVALASVVPCYAASNATSNLYNDITGFSIGSLNNPSTCATTGGGGSSLNMYSNYNALPPPKLGKGSTYPFTVNFTNCGATNYNYGTAIFIDLNGNGVYTDAGERVYANTAAVAGVAPISGNVTIPSTPNVIPGITGMRVIHAYNIAGTAISPTGTYTYGETEDYLVNILYQPVVTPAGGVFCQEDTVTLSATIPGLSGNFTYLWTGPNGFTDTTSSITFQNIQANAIGNYTVRALLYPCAGGVPDTTGVTTISIYVNPKPTPPIVAENIVYCQGDPFTGLPIFGNDLKWYTVPKQLGGTPSTTAPVVNTSVFGTVTYYVSQTIDGCESERTPVTISVAPKPNPPQVVSPVNYCQGETSAPLVAIGQNVRWYSVPVGGAGTPVTPVPGTNAQGKFTWYASQTVAGCESKRVPVEVNINYVPNALITKERPYVCQYDTITLTYFGNATNTADFIWTMPNGASLVSGSGAGPFVIRFDSAGIQRVWLTVDNGGCVSRPAFLDVPVKLSPRLTLDLQPDACKDEIVNIAIAHATPGIDFYDWDFDGAEVVYGSFPAGPFGIRWNSAGDKVVNLVGRDELCKSLPELDTIHVHDLPEANIEIINRPNDKICSGDSVQLRASQHPESGASYQWLPQQFFGESNANEQWGKIGLTGPVTVHVTSKYNCRSSNTLVIDTEPCCNVGFPNAFTPNNDGRNDRFGMITRGHHQLLSFRVQNRWGQTVFETANAEVGWDGNFNGEPQDMGTYFYYVKYKCTDGKTYEDKGELILVR